MEKVELELAKQAELKLDIKIDRILSPGQWFVICSISQRDPRKPENLFSSTGRKMFYSLLCRPKLPCLVDLKEKTAVNYYVDTAAKCFFQKFVRTVEYKELSLIQSLCILKQQAGYFTHNHVFCSIFSYFFQISFFD